jgi:hypothetical protein
MLEMVLQLDPDPDRMPVTSDLIESLREVIAEGVNGGYDIDEVLFNLAIAISGLETSLLNRKSELLSLETRILQAGLRLSPAD